MNTKVKLKGKCGGVMETSFAHAQKILQIDKHNVFEVAEPNKYQFINNELIKRPSKKGNKKRSEQEPSPEGE
jgi:hypothetical protein